MCFDKKESGIPADEKFVPIIMEALVDIDDGFSPKAQYIYKYHGKIKSISWKNIGSNLNIYNALSVIWGTYSLLALTPGVVAAGMTLVALLKDMLELTNVEFNNDDILVLYYAKKCGAANCWIEESTVFEQIKEEKAKGLPENEEIRSILASFSEKTVSRSLSQLEKIKVIDIIGGKIKICESISPNALKELSLK